MNLTTKMRKHLRELSPHTFRKYNVPEQQPKRLRDRRKKNKKKNKIKGDYSGRVVSPMKNILSDYKKSLMKVFGW